MVGIGRWVESDLCIGVPPSEIRSMERGGHSIGQRGHRMYGPASMVLAVVSVDGIVRDPVEAQAGSGELMPRPHLAAVDVE